MCEGVCVFQHKIFMFMLSFVAKICGRHFVRCAGAYAFYPCLFNFIDSESAEFNKFDKTAIHRILLKHQRKLGMSKAIGGLWISILHPQGVKVFFHRSPSRLLLPWKGLGL